MTTGPIDLDDAQLDAVTGGGNPLTSGSKITLPSGTSALKDLAASIDQHTTSSSTLGSIAKDLATGQNTMTSGKVSQVAPSGSAQLADMIQTLNNLGSKSNHMTFDQRKAAFDSIVKQTMDIKGGVEQSMKDPQGTIHNLKDAQNSAQNLHDAQVADNQAQRINGSNINLEKIQSSVDMINKMMDVIHDVRAKLSAIEQSSILENRAIAKKA